MVARQSGMLRVEGMRGDRHGWEPRQDEPPSSGFRWGFGDSRGLWGRAHLDNALLVCPKADGWRTWLLRACATYDGAHSCCGGAPQTSLLRVPLGSSAWEGSGLRGHLRSTGLRHEGSKTQPRLLDASLVCACASLPRSHLIFIF